jgi:nucleoside-diphosphate-sugar epimerase
VTRRVALTGAGGFVGRHLVRAASRSGFDVVGIVRSEAGARAVAEAGGTPVRKPGLEAASLEPCFAGVEAIVHLAQIGRERGGDTFEAVNVDGTREVAAAAREAGVSRLLLFSGLGVASYGRKARTTNAYFLSKLAAEVAVYRGAGEALILRPSYVIGPGDGLSTWLLASMAAGEVARPGDGAYRLQPVALDDVVAAALVLLKRPLQAFEGPIHRVWDLVGPEALSFEAFLRRLGGLARGRGLVEDYRVTGIPVAECERQARAGGFHGMGPEDLDCLLCDEVADPAPLRELLGRELTCLEDAMATALTGGV